MPSFKGLSPSDQIREAPTSPRSIVAMNRCGITPADIIYVTQEELRHRIAYKSLNDREFAVYYENYECMRQEALAQAIEEYHLILQDGLEDAERALYPTLKFSKKSQPRAKSAVARTTAVHDPDDLKLRAIERHLKEVEQDLRQRIAHEAQQQQQLEAAHEHQQKMQELANWSTARYDDEAVKYVLQEQHRLGIIEDFQVRQEKARIRSQQRTMQELEERERLKERRQRILDDASERSKTRSVPREEFLYQLAMERKAEDRARELEFKERQLIREQRSQRAQEMKNANVERLRQELRESQERHTRAFEQYWEEVARSKSADHVRLERRRQAGLRRVEEEASLVNSQRISQTDRRISEVLANFGEIYRAAQTSKQRKIEADNLRSSRQLDDTAAQLRARLLEDELLQDLRTRRAEMHLRRVQYQKEHLLSEKEHRAASSVQGFNRTREKEAELTALVGKLQAQRQMLQGNASIRSDGIIEMPEEIRRLAPPGSLLRCRTLSEAIEKIRGEEGTRRLAKVLPMSETYGSVFAATNSPHSRRRDSLSRMSPRMGMSSMRNSQRYSDRDSSLSTSMTSRTPRSSVVREQSAVRRRKSTSTTPRSSFASQPSERPAGGTPLSKLPARKPGQVSTPRKSQTEAPKESIKALRVPKPLADPIVPSLPQVPGYGVARDEAKRNSIVQQEVVSARKHAKKSKASTPPRTKPLTVEVPPITDFGTTKTRDELAAQSHEIAQQLARLTQPKTGPSLPSAADRRELFEMLRSDLRDDPTLGKSRRIFDSLTNSSLNTSNPSSVADLNVHMQVPVLKGTDRYSSAGAAEDLVLTAFARATPEATLVNTETPRDNVSLLSTNQTLDESGRSPLQTRQLNGTSPVTLSASGRLAAEANDDLKMSELVSGLAEASPLAGSRASIGRFVANQGPRDSCGETDE